MKNDTIVAISTPAGVGGIAVARLSGPDALPLALRHLSVESLAPRHATYCRFDELDDVVAVYYPRGYSGEPTVEFSCHGSLYVQQALIQTLVDEGARMAEAGEFTLRAFLNGCLDLSQAEAVADLIDAVTPAQHRLAVSQLRGGYAKELRNLRQQLLDLTSLMELELDFSQEDVEFADRDRLRQLLATIHSSVSNLIGSFSMGNALKRGIPVAIVGEPNVGKSTLLNALLQDDRAIVSPVPGTTRDTIEETLTMGGVTFRLVDTAGLRHTDDEVERLGIERSRRAREQAMIVIHLIDATSPSSTQSFEPTENQEVIVAMNKCDLHGCPPAASPLIHLSAKTGEGLDRLKQAMLDAVGDRVSGDTLLSNLRHREALLHVQQALKHVSEGMDDNLPSDLLVVDLRDALYHLGTITGDVTSDDILSNIFSRFCVGK